MDKVSAPLVLAAALLGGSVHAQTPAPAAMTDEAIPTSTVEEAHLSLRAEFRFDAARHVLRIRYLLNNGGKAAVALFDRGDNGAVQHGRLKAGMAAPVSSERHADDLTFSHRATPSGTPAATPPLELLAARVAAGSQLGGDILADPQTAARLRYCLGVAPFDAGLFSSPQSIDGVDLWRASSKAVDTQKLLCTSWFDVSRRAFVGH